MCKDIGTVAALHAAETAHARVGNCFNVDGNNCKMSGDRASSAARTKAVSCSMLYAMAASTPYEPLRAASSMDRVLLDGVVAIIVISETVLAESRFIDGINTPRPIQFDTLNTF
jgi:hypothetical protein